MKSKFTSLAIFLVIFSSKAQVPNYVPASSLQAWYGFNGNANDISGNTNNLSVVNGASLSTDRFSNANSAYFLDGIDDWLETTTNFYNPSLPHTLSIWWKTTDSSKTNQTLFNTNPHPTENLSFHYSSSNPTPPYSLFFGLGNGIPGSWSIMNPDNGQITIAPDFNVWHQTVWVRSSNNWTFYEDGNAVYTYTDVANTTPTLTTLRFGAENNLPSGGAQFKGMLDDIGIWDRALTPCEIAHLYNASTTNVNAATSASVICVGQSATLTANGASTYTWNPGNLNGSTVVVSPTVTTTYTLATSNSTTGCNDTATLTENVGVCAGIASVAGSESQELKIYPNPGTGEFSVFSTNDDEIEVTDQLGRVIKKINILRGQNYNILNLLPGIYFISSTDPSNSKVQKVIVIK